MKLLLLLLAFSLPILAVSINESLLKVHSILVPKLYVMDYQYKDKIKNNKIKIAIIYKEVQYKSAKILQELINKKYKKGILSFSIKPILIHHKDLNNTYANIYYLFPLDENNINKVIQHAKNQHALTFSYLSSDLAHGVMISINVENKIRPILNLHSIQANHINLRPMLIRISSIYND